MLLLLPLLLLLLLLLLPGEDHSVERRGPGGYKGGGEECHGLEYEHEAPAVEVRRGASHHAPRRASDDGRRHQPRVLQRAQPKVLRDDVLGGQNARGGVGT